MSSNIRDSITSQMIVLDDRVVAFIIKPNDLANTKNNTHLFSIMSSPIYASYLSNGDIIPAEEDMNNLSFDPGISVKSDWVQMSETLLQPYSLMVIHEATWHRLINSYINNKYDNPANIKDLGLDRVRKQFFKSYLSMLDDFINVSMELKNCDVNDDKYNTNILAYNNLMRKLTLRDTTHPQSRTTESLPLFCDSLNDDVDLLGSNVNYANAQVDSIKSKLLALCDLDESSKEYRIIKNKIMVDIRRVWDMSAFWTSINNMGIRVLPSNYGGYGSDDNELWDFHMKTLQFGFHSKVRSDVSDAWEGDAPYGYIKDTWVKKIDDLKKIIASLEDGLEFELRDKPDWQGTYLADKEKNILLSDLNNSENVIRNNDKQPSKL